MNRRVIAGLLASAAALVVVLILGLSLPRVSVVQQSDEIAAPPATVYQLLIDLQAARRWSPWRDARSRYLFSGPLLGAGAHMEWVGPTRGSTTIATAEPYRRVIYDIRREGDIRRGVFELTRSAQGAHVTWRMETDGGASPLARLRDRFLKEQTRLSLERGLARLEDVAEALPHADLETARVDLVKLPERRFLYVQGETTRDPAAVGRALAEGASRARRALTRAGLGSSSGPVWVAQAKPGSDRLTYRAGLVFEGPGGAPSNGGEGGLKNGMLTAGSFVQAEQVGSSAELRQAEAAARLFTGLHRLTLAGPTQVEFSADPAATPPDQLKAVIRVPVSSGA